MSSFGTKLNRQGACARVQCTVHNILPTGRKIGLHSYNYSLPIHQQHPLKQHPKHSTSSQHSFTQFISRAHMKIIISLCFSVFTSLPKNRATKSHNRMDRRVISKLVVNLWLVELSEAECYCFVFFLCMETFRRLVSSEKGAKPMRWRRSSGMVFKSRNKSSFETS